MRENPALHGNAILTSQEMCAAAKEKATQQALTKPEDCKSSVLPLVHLFMVQRKSPCVSRMHSLLVECGTAWPERAVDVRRTTTDPSPLLPRTWRGRC